MDLVAPPLPDRPERYPPPLALLRMAKRNLISVFPEAAFGRDILVEDLWRRRIVVGNSPGIVRDVLVTHWQDYPKSRQLQRALEPLIGDGMFISNGAPWQRRRAIAAGLFKQPMLKAFSAVVIEATLELCERWHRLAAPRIVDMNEEMTRLTADIIARCLFSERLGEADSRRIFQAFSVYQSSLTQFAHADLVGLPAWVPRLPSLRAHLAARAIHRILERLIAERQAAGGPHDDLLTALMAATDEATGARFSPREVRDEMAVFLLAGHESTASALGWAWFLLSGHPPALAEVVAEVDAHLGTREATYDDLRELPVIDRCVQEALRLYPPIAVYPRDVACPHTYDSRDVPAGSLMLIVPWLLHRHRGLWERPDAFCPERFTEEASRGRPRQAFVPFGAGPRTCLGASFAMMETTLIIATIIRRFTLACVEPGAVAPVCRFTLRPLPRLLMTIEDRGTARRD